MLKQKWRNRLPLGTLRWSRFCATKMAEPTRLELATSAVTGQRSNQLSYDSSTYILYIIYQNKSTIKDYIPGILNAPGSMAG